MVEKIIAIVDAPVLNFPGDYEAIDVIRQFYRDIGWNGDDKVDNFKVLTNRAVIKELQDLMNKCTTGTYNAGNIIVGLAPHIDESVPPGKVYLLEGWITPISR